MGRRPKVKTCVHCGFELPLSEFISKFKIKKANKILNKTCRKCLGG